MRFIVARTGRYPAACCFFNVFESFKDCTDALVGHRAIRELRPLDAQQSPPVECGGRSVRGLLV